MMRDRIRASAIGGAATALLAALIVVGSRRLAHFDAALVGYTFATLFAAFGITYRYAMWLQRPPTGVYWKRGWQLFLRRATIWPQSACSGRVAWASMFALNAFIWRRGSLRGAAHWLIMWGCVIAAAITFPLVFGWIHFETVPGRSRSVSRLSCSGSRRSRSRSIRAIGFLVFHGLVWASFLVIAGVMLAMRRRMRDHGAAALQQFGEDFLPLIALFAISVTGLMLTASYTWMRGYAYEFLAILHAITVIFTLLWLPFGKFFHIFQRPAQLGVELLQGDWRARRSRLRAAAAARRSPRECTWRT